MTETRLYGSHHTARPTWKLAETLHFYRDVMGLPVMHAISAKGWGPEDHPDFLHFFFEAGQGSTIAFFYYIGTERPEWLESRDSFFYRSTHTAWRVERREELDLWRERFERFGVETRIVPHEIIESLYATDPNGYMVEITWQRREASEADRVDANLTLEAAAELEAEGGVADIDAVWRRKARHVRRMLGEAA